MAHLGALQLRAVVHVLLHNVLLQLNLVQEGNHAALVGARNVLAPVVLHCKVRQSRLGGLG